VRTLPTSSWIIDLPRRFHELLTCRSLRVVAVAAGFAFALAILPRTADAVLDIGDRGPALKTGRLVLRVTNAGILGNAFFHTGLSSDPSFEFPAYSGHECLNYAALWVGAVNAQGLRRVSGGPLMEWRPTLDPNDRVQIRQQGDPGTRRQFDDDRDFKVDEDPLNGRDDDGDGKVDEDLGLFSYQMLSADYADDRPEAAYVSDGGETHQGLGLSVHQEVYGWTAIGHEGIAGLQFTIRNHGSATLRDVYVGLFADLDSRRHGDGLGHLDDQVVTRGASMTFSRGASLVRVGGQNFSKGCFAQFSHEGPVVVDTYPNSGLPAVTVVPLSHTTDPLAFIHPEYARAPARQQFRTSTLLNGYPAPQGGVPLNDADRYAALAGTLPHPSLPIHGDVAVLVSCGPFATLGPGQSIDFAVALVAGVNPDSVARGIENAALDYEGHGLNRLPDAEGTASRQWYVGETGLNGHEACIDVPPNVTFTFDPHCPDKFWYQYPGHEEPDFPSPASRPVLYQHGQCVWTDADCDACTGFGGDDAYLPWSDPGEIPPGPTMHLVGGDHRIDVLWDNVPEVLMGLGLAGPRQAQFTGYNVYRLNGWHNREGLVPPLKNWSLIATFDADTSQGALPLATVVDTSYRPYFRPDGLRVFPPGRYHYVDDEVLNGFDYLYVVTTRAVIHGTEEQPLRQNFESAFAASFSALVTPREEARDVHPSVWVVPNPFRGGASWDRPEIRGDVLTRHVDFMGMPRAHATIKIWTLAGDFVARIDHDGSGGDGQARWNLVSRNGQDVSSGVYLFTVESSLGSETGRFVILR
jgi:hypothetical protein